jgi:hypothetical protein
MRFQVRGSLEDTFVRHFTDCFYILFSFVVTKAFQMRP